MAHDVFICHASQDKPVADAACAALESVAIRCWIAPRDVQPGRAFAGEITRAIQRSKALVLIFSTHSNKSEQVLREVQLAANSHLHIVQFRIQNVIPSDDLEYYLSAPHWLDALSPPLENHLERLKSSVKALLQMDSREAAAATAQAEPQLSSEGLELQRREPNRWMSALVAAVAVCAILLALLFWQFYRRPSTEAQIPGRSSATAAAPGSPSVSPIARRESEQPKQIAPAKGALLSSHNYDMRLIRPLVSTDIMSVLTISGEPQITGKSPGILPAIFDKLLLENFVIECGMRADEVPVGARYGFIFRAADVRNGAIARYYALMLDPNQRIVAMSCWMDTRWTMNAEQQVPADLLQFGRRSRLTVEASGHRFRAFINDRFVAEFAADELNTGRIGLCLSGVNAQPWTVRFDNFQVFLLP